MFFSRTKKKSMSRLHLSHYFINSYYGQFRTHVNFLYILLII
nr:MAG TPA: hypothetical protein [Caudoviricetes sp.]